MAQVNLPVQIKVSFGFLNSIINNYFLGRGIDNAVKNLTFQGIDPECSFLQKRKVIILLCRSVRSRASFNFFRILNGLMEQNTEKSVEIQEQRKVGLECYLKSLPTF